MAQKTKLPFQSGEWKVNLTMVLNNGKPMNTETEVCAANPQDAWNPKRPGQICDPIQLTPVANGFHMQMHCKGGSGPVVTEIHVDMMTHFAKDGQSYTEDGTSTSSTTMPGRPPMVMSIQMKGQGTRVGPCTTPPTP
ncbi:MAG: DUF3617 domain-containing protein [Acidobacteriaceae bacterium]